MLLQEERSLGRRAGEDDVGLGGAGHHLRQRAVHDVDALDFLSDRGDSLLGTVDDDHAGAALGSQVLDDEFAHLAGADEEHARGQRGGAGELHKGELDGCGADGDGAGGDVGFAAHALAGGDGILEEPVNVLSQAAGFLADSDHLLHLRQYLALSQHQRVQPGRHLKKVTRRVPVPEHEQVLLQL